MHSESGILVSSPVMDPLSRLASWACPCRWKGPGVPDSSLRYWLHCSVLLWRPLPPVVVDDHSRYSNRSYFVMIVVSSYCNMHLYCKSAYPSCGWLACATAIVGNVKLFLFQMIYHSRYSRNFGSNTPLSVQSVQRGIQWNSSFQRLLTAWLLPDHRFAAKMDRSLPLIRMLKRVCRRAC